MSWDPAQYLRFADQRLRPAVELLARIPQRSPACVYDLGCGAGNVTRLLRERWPDARIVGVDSSVEMLERAAREAPGIEWVHDDLASWRPPQPADVVFSSATLQWLDGHERLFPELLDSVAPGGAFALQMPRNFGAPSHKLMREVAGSGPWRARLEPLLRSAPVGSPSFYYELLAPRAPSVDVWETEYVHVLSGDDPVLQWTRGTALRPLLAALAPAEREGFEHRYAELLRTAYQKRADGTTLFPFRRLFIVAIRASTA